MLSILNNLKGFAYHTSIKSVQSIMARPARTVRGKATTSTEASKQTKDDVKGKTNKQQSGEHAKKANNDDNQSSEEQCWLMKAEPDPRMEKGIDISFSVDKFASMPNKITQWDGVRNPEAKTMMKEKMRMNDKVLFYHSNCKLPGIAGLARVVKEGYPDYTAWDVKHPYFDAKTDKEQPKWFMVDVQLQQKLPYLVPLALLQLISQDKTKTLDYLTDSHRSAITSMQLLNRGRLSVQKVEPKAFEAIVMLGSKGGWQEWPGKWQTKQKGDGKRMVEEEERVEEISKKKKRR